MESEETDFKLSSEDNTDKADSIHKLEQSSPADTGEVNTNNHQQSKLSPFSGLMSKTEKGRGLGRMLTSGSNL